MQANSDDKRRRIIDGLDHIDLHLHNINIDNSEDKARQLMDYRRQLLADLTSLPPVNVASRHYPGCLKYEPTTVVAEQVKKWRTRVIQFEPDQRSFKNPNFCDQFLDSILPETWNFSSDVMVISAPPSNTIISKAILRNQSHIVIFDYHKCIDEQAITRPSNANVVLCQTISDVEIAFAKLQTPAERVITVPCSIDAKFLTKTKDRLSEAIQKGKINRIANTVTANRFGAPWSKNLLHNLPIIANAPNIHQLTVKGVKDAVIVASGPSLNRNIHTLAKIQDRVFIVAALRSLKILNDANIKPDLVIQLDAEDDNVAREFLTKLDIEIENFLVDLTINPWFLKSNAKNLIWSYPSLFDDISRRFGVAPTPFDAPSVAIYGLMLCYQLGFESLCFIGQDLASSERLQYARGATSLLPAHNDITTFDIEIDGFYGNKVMTRGAYHIQLLRCEHVATELNLKAPQLRLFNATEGGAYINGFKHISLSEFASTRDLNSSRHVKQLMWESGTQIKPTHLADYLAHISDTMDEITTIANAIIKLDKAPKKSLDEDRALAELVEKFRFLNSTTSLLQVAMQEEISSVIGTSSDNCRDSSLSGFFREVLRHTETLKSIALMPSK